MRYSGMTLIGGLVSLLSFAGCAGVDVKEGDLFQSGKAYRWDVEFEPSEPGGEPDYGVMTLQFSRMAHGSYLATGSFTLRGKAYYYLHGNALLFENEIHIALDGTAVIEVETGDLMSNGKTLAVIDRVTMDGTFQGSDIHVQKPDGAIMTEYFQGKLTLRGEGS